MRRTRKAKLAIHVEMPLQLTSTNSDSGTLGISLEKRKEDARKPLYLKRV